MGLPNSRPAQPETTIIIPTYNEVDHISATIQTIQRNRHSSVEIIVTDGFSNDRTQRVARHAGAKVICVRGGRAAQLNEAAKLARAPHLLFLHADTAVAPAFDTEVSHILAKRGVVAGAFSLSIDSHLLSMRLVETGANWRASFFQRPYGDQALFLSRDTFAQIGGYPHMSFLEDYEITRRLARYGRIHISVKPVSTSARRWQILGALRTTLMNNAIIAAYHCGVPPDNLRKWYRNTFIKAMQRNQVISS